MSDYLDKLEPMTATVKIVDSPGDEAYGEIDIERCGDQIELSVFIRRTTGDERIDCECVLYRVLDVPEARELHAALGKILEDR